MKLGDLLEQSYFVKAVAHAVQEIAGADSEVAALIVEDEDGMRRRALIASHLGVLDCVIDANEPSPARSVGHPLVTKLHRWSDWPRITINGETYGRPDRSFSTVWSVEGLPEGVRLTHPSQRSQEIAEFVRACVERQER